MKQVSLHILENTAPAQGIYRLRLGGDVSAVTAPGQFVNIKLDGFFLRRPISVCDWQDGELTLIYKVLGRGTAQMATLPVGTVLDVLTGLGNGYTMEPVHHALLIGGGVGVPPLYNLCKCLRAAGQQVTVILGFNTADEVFYAEEFAALGAEVRITTVDGSVGTKGFVTDAFPAEYDYFYTCGPLPMLRAVYDRSATSGQFSFEERMGCGFGACMGCSCKTKYGNKRICKDGPVLVKEEIIW